MFSVIPLPLVTLLILLFGKTIGKKFQQAHEAYSHMSDTVQETFAGIRVIKSFVKEWWFVKKFAADNDEYRKANMELVRLFGMFFPLVTFLSQLTVLLMLVIGGIRVINGLMSPGSLVAMFRYLTMLIWPLMGAGFMVNLIQRGAVSLGRINEILSAVPSIRNGEGASHSPPEPSKALEIKNLSFAYGDNMPVLENINLTVGQGEWLGIMGKTGSGKSTLVKTLMRMVDPPAGTVFVYGRDVRDWPLSELRSRFAVSPQDSYLFSDTIQNNITFGVNSPDDGLMHKTLSMAALEKDIAEFAGGSDTLIGEKGLTLSGGQKQRVAVARALAMSEQPAGGELLILDDSFSAVDAETELKMLNALVSERKCSARQQTTIIISHRVSTLRYMNKVLVLENGKQSEYGSPEELAAAGGFFARMAALQRLDSDCGLSNKSCKIPV
jgi:ATP-binding cassette subfamily B protein